MSTTKLNPQITGNVGLYFTCYHLSLLGWNVMPTSRNARGVDIIAYDSTVTNFIGVQVKALSRRHAVPVGTSLEKVMGDFWVIVNNILAQPSAFILLPSEVRSLSHSVESAGRVSYWLEPKEYDQPQFRGAWDRIGRGDLQP